MISVRGGLCRNLWAEVDMSSLGSLPTEKREEMVAKRNQMAALWNIATNKFVETCGCYDLMKKGNSAFVFAAYGEDSTQAKIENTFWSAVTRNPSLVGRADTLVSAVENQFRENVRQAFHFEGKAPSLILSQLDSLRSSVSRIFARSCEDPIVREYAKCQVNLWILCQVILNGRDELFHDVTLERIKQAEAILETMRRSRGVQQAPSTDFDPLFIVEFRKRVKDWQKDVLDKWWEMMKGDSPNSEFVTIDSMIPAGFDDMADRFAPLEKPTVKEVVENFSHLNIAPSAKGPELIREKLLQNACFAFVQNPYNRELWKRAELAFVQACFGADSPQCLLVNTFWDQVKDSSEGLQLLCIVEKLIFDLFQSASPSFTQQIQQILTSPESATEKANKIFSVFEALKSKICDCLGIKDAYRSEKEKIMHEYAQFRANLCVAYTIVECGAEKLFATLSCMYREQKTSYVEARRPLLEACVAWDSKLLDQIDEQSKDFYVAQFKETCRRFNHLDEIAHALFKEADEIEAFQKKVGTPFFAALLKWRKALSVSFQKIMSKSESTQSYLFFIIEQELEERIALFEPLKSS